MVAFSIGKCAAEIGAPPYPPQAEANQDRNERHVSFAGIIRWPAQRRRSQILPRDVHRN